MNIFAKREKKKKKVRIQVQMLLVYRSLIFLLGVNFQK